VGWGDDFRRAQGVRRVCVCECVRVCMCGERQWSYSTVRHRQLYTHTARNFTYTQHATLRTHTAHNFTHTQHTTLRTHSTQLYAQQEDIHRAWMWLQGRVV